MANPVVYFSVIPNCNSSSSHHLIHRSNGVRAWSESESFWRNMFVLKSLKEKEVYLQTMACHLGIEDKFCEKFKTKMGATVGASIDHQSLWSIPKDRKTGEPSVEYVLRAMQYILDNDDIYIGGGGDEYEQPEWYKVHPMDIVRCVYTKYAVKYSDDVWGLMNEYEPTKAIIGFGSNDEVYPHTVDVKITGYCERECPECYQNSNRQGVHAPLDRIKAFIDKCFDNGIIEIAFGGGEPTKHPDFQKIIDYCFRKKIRPNFTTRDLDAALALHGDLSFALSVDSMEDAAAALHKRNDSHENYDKHMNFHIIAWPKTMEKIIEFTKNFNRKENYMTGTVVMLDPKMNVQSSVARVQREMLDIDTDMVANFWAKLDDANHYTSEEAWDAGKEYQKIEFAMDIPMIKQYEDQLNMDEMHYYTDEGKHSFYYDAVEDKTYKCSYELEEVKWENGQLSNITE